MNILLLGNGFDLHYYLPTKYNNFLQTVEYLMNHTLFDPMTAGNVFSDKKLKEKDSFISICYDKNKDAFDNAILDSHQISELVNLANENMWFKYLHASFNKDVGWIDFEQEIKKVLSEIRKTFDLNVVWGTFILSKEPALKHMLKYFSFFIEDFGQNTYEFKKEYLVEDPNGSNNYKLDVDSIVATLFDELCNLGKMLKIYLSQFIEKSIPSINDNELNEWIKIYDPQHIITFNYTNTFEQLFSNSNVIHIHGTNDNNIVLGINPDSDDEIESIDTVFLFFKKYYQRVFWETDVKYLNSTKVINDYFEDGLPVILTVIGHSLDETDKDIIIELFKYATEIYILYYNSKTLSNYVNNLVKIFGKHKFDELRNKKRMKFIHLSKELDNKATLNGAFNTAILNAMQR